MEIAALAFAVVLAEVSLRIMVWRLRPGFPWLITIQDEIPALDPSVIAKYATTSHDSELGWVRSPGTEGWERGPLGTTNYKIDERGSRFLPDDAPARIASFGDSYVFCRHVDDPDTWQSEFARLSGLGILNYGVGNYGADQAFMRYRRQALPEEIETVILGFVPETICRIQSFWKHYLEFGNHLAFKPKVELGAEGQIVFRPNILQDPFELERIADLLPHVQPHDRFYEERFRRFQFRKSYLLSAFRAPLTQLAMFANLVCSGPGDKGVEKGSMVRSGAFATIMRRNIRYAHALYQEKRSTDLLERLLEEFVSLANRRGHNPLIVVFPQLLDLTRTASSYRAFYARISKKLPVYDLTADIEAEGVKGLYQNDISGGHLSPQGNRFVAKVLAHKLLPPA